MSYQPPPGGPVMPYIHPFSLGAIPAFHYGIATPASAVWPTANTAIYVPLNLPTGYLVKRLWCLNGGTAAGNIDIGIYDAAGNRLTSSGAVAQAGTNAIQHFDITDYLLAPGSYYMAMSCSLGTATVWKSTGQSATFVGIAGCLSQASAHPLPATATFASAIITIPFFGITNTATP